MISRSRFILFCAAWAFLSASVMTCASAGGSQESDSSYAADRRVASTPFDAASFAQTFSHHKVTIDGVTLHYVEGGTGRSILLLHGWPETWYSWRRVMPSLAARHRVVAVDMPGFGDSESAPSADKQTIARLIAGFCTQLHLGPSTIVGHDMGGPVAYALAATRPDLVRRLVLMEAALPGFGFADGSADDILNPTEQNVPGIWHFTFFMKTGEAELLVPGHERAFVVALTKDSFYNPAAFGEDELEETARWLISPGGLSGGLAYYRALFADARANKVLARKKLEMPVLIIDGSEGFLQHVLPVSARAVASNVRVAVAPRSGHFIADERPTWLADALLSFADDGR